MIDRRRHTPKTCALQTGSYRHAIMNKAMLRAAFLLLAIAVGLVNGDDGVEGTAVLTEEARIECCSGILVEDVSSLPAAW